MRTCTFPGCDQPYKARGYCHGHYQQDARGISLRPIRHITAVRPEHSCACVPSARCYTYHGCRCEGCCAAHTRKHKAWRHGGPTLVDSAGTIRRLQALCRVGFSRDEIGQMLGLSRGNIEDLVSGNRARITKQTRARVRRIYEAHWQGPPAATTPTEKCRRSRAVNAARRKGWPPPMSWDDDTIDDPTATPNLGDSNDKRSVVDEVEHLLGTDSTDNIAARLGYRDRDCLYVALRRDGREDLLDKLSRSKRIEADSMREPPTGRRKEAA